MVNIKMSNLYNTLEKLKQFSDNRDLSDDQYAFIFSIMGMLNGNHHKDHLEHIKTLIQNELSRTPDSSQKTQINIKYNDVLNDVVHDVEVIEKTREKIATFSPKRIEKFSKIFDRLYSDTPNYGGTLMLPINQGLDFRLGDSGGECFGYVAEWAAKILKKQNPFGIDVDVPSPFKPISFNSPAGRMYPDLNHLAILNDDIASYQKLQTNKNGLGDRISSELKEIGKSIGFKGERSILFYNSVDEPVEQLVQQVSEDSTQVYNLNVYGYLTGHALGFCKINNKYHFFDSNSGWFRFDNTDDFKRWLPFYFKTIGYDKIFSEYNINTYSLFNVDVNKESNAEDKKENGSKLLSIILITLLSPFILIYVAALLCDLYIIRGFRYAALAVKNWFTPEEEASRFLEPRSNSEPENKPIPKSFDYLDLAVSKEPAPAQTKQSSLAKIAGMLDLPTKNLAQVAQRAATNEEFNRARGKTKLFNSHSIQVSKATSESTSSQLGV
jgi:hypothetical protein